MCTTLYDLGPVVEIILHDGIFVPIIPKWDGERFREKTNFDVIIVMGELGAIWEDMADPFPTDNLREFSPFPLGNGFDGTLR